MVHFTLNKPYLKSGPNLLHTDKLIYHPPQPPTPPPTRSSTQLTDGPNNTSKVDRTDKPSHPIVHFTLNKLYLTCGPSLPPTDQLAHPPISVNRTPFTPTAPLHTPNPTPQSRPSLPNLTSLATDKPPRVHSLIFSSTEQHTECASTNQRRSPH